LGEVSYSLLHGRVDVVLQNLLAERICYLQRWIYEDEEEGRPKEGEVNGISTEGDARPGRRST